MFDDFPKAVRLPMSAFMATAPKPLRWRARFPVHPGSVRGRMPGTAVRPFALGRAKAKPLKHNG